MFPVGNHIIFYTIVEQDIQVLRVVHGARDFNLLF
jgi:plasmid stabilization system protein ParE